MPALPSPFLRLREQTAQPRAELPFKVTAVSGGCRPASFVTGNDGVTRRKMRCEGRGSAPGHKRGHNAHPPLAAPMGGRTPLYMTEAAQQAPSPRDDAHRSDRETGSSFFWGNHGLLYANDVAGPKPFNPFVGIDEPLFHD